jgi:hypothetical protein
LQAGERRQNLVVASEDGEQQNVPLQGRRIVFMVWMDPFPVHCSALIVWAFRMFKTYQMKKKYLALFEVKETRWLENSIFASAENIL